MFVAPAEYNDAMMRKGSILVTSLLFLSLCISAPLQASDRKEIEEQLNTQLKGQIVTFRHFYKGSRLKFDHAGKLKGKSRIGSWTIYGKILITKIKVKKNRYEIHGKRIFHGYDDERETFYLHEATKIRLDLDIDSAQPGQTGFYRQIGQIFLTSGTKLKDVVPDYWKPFLAGERHEVIGDQSKQQEKANNPKEAPPRCVSCPNPTYPAQVLENGIEGTITFAGMINQEGHLEEIQLLKGLNPQIDRIAQKTIQKWELVPPMKRKKNRFGFLPPIFIRLNVSKSTNAPILESSKAMTNPRCLSCPDPDYPQAARAERFHGTVILTATIRKSGVVDNITIVKPVGFGLDDNAAVAIRKWKFQPATYRGLPFDLNLYIEVTFSIF